MHGEYYRASSTRPVSLLDTDNRLVANSWRILLELLVCKIISDMQLCFVKGWSIMRMTLEIDLESTRASLLYNRAALVLFD